MTSITGSTETEATQMAYAGNASDLAKQTAPSTSSGRAGSWKPLVTAIVVVAILVVAAMSAAFLAGSNRAVGLPTAGLSRAQIDDVLVPVAPAGLSRAQIDDVLVPVGPASLSRAQIASLQSVAPAGMSRAQIASLQSVAPAANLQRGISRMVYQTAPQIRLRRTAP
jgi:hypothetical protein